MSFVRPLNPVLSRTLRSLQRNIVAGVITIGPLFVTCVVFGFVLGTLAKVGMPVVQFLATIFRSEWLSEAWVQWLLGVILTLIVLYLVGRLTSEVIGREMISLLEAELERLPFVAKVYTSVRQLIDTMMTKKGTSQRVVLVDFPIEGHKSIGFLTKTMTDKTSGQLLATVLLPNAINPTSAFLQILPFERVVETDLTMEQAMSMLLTGGAVGPDSVVYCNTEMVTVEVETTLSSNGD